MPDPAPHPELLRSLGRLVRGLSALFWGLPLALIVCVQTAKTDWLIAFTFFPPLAATGLLLYGLWQLGSFQKQERPWRSALDRAGLFALINFGLSPFLYWWNRIPEQPFFAGAVIVLAFSGLLFLLDVNVVLRRLGSMLPDETLRSETRQYTRFNRGVLAVLLALSAAYVLLAHLLPPPVFHGSISPYSYFTDLLSQQIIIPALGIELNGFWLLWLPACLLILLPLSMTMALIWKTKEVILDSVFGARG